MNILPLIFGFLIIFSFITLSFSREIKSLFLTETVLEGMHRVERKVNNAIARKTYQKIKKESSVKKSGDSQQKKKRTYICRRSLMPPLESSKFNLSPLLQYQAEVKLHPLYEPLAKFLRVLYKDTLFSQLPHAEKIEYRLLEAIFQKAHSLSEIQNLSELYPQDPQLAAIFYKMLRGTNQYRRHKGIPPLEDFFSIQKEKTAVSLSFASPLLLEAFFGEEITALILNEEKKKREDLNKYYFFSKEDLTTLLSNKSALNSFTALEPYFNYSKQLPARQEIAGKDKKTEIKLKKPIYIHK